MAIVRLALSNPSASTNTLLHTATRNSIVSVIATNKSALVAAQLDIWIQPQGSSSESQYVFLSYDTILPTANSLETFRFPLNVGDSLYVAASTSNVSFSLNAIYESNGTSHITTGSTEPLNPSIGDVFVNTISNNVLYWSGSSWVNGVADISSYPFSKFQSSSPAGPAVGQIWIDSDDNATYVWSGTSWIPTTSPGSSYQSNAPVSPAPKVGQLWVDSDTSIQYVWTGSTWLALSDPDMVTLTGTQTLTNKTLTSPTLNSPQINNPTTTIGINPRVASYTAVLSDRDKLIEMNVASANTFTVPLNSSVAFPTGSTINIVQTGAGQTTITATGGVVINATPGLKLRTQWSTATLIKRDTNTWLAFGDLIA